MRRDHCPACGCRSLNCFLNRHQVPVHQNLVVADRQAARTVLRGELEMTSCEACGFVFNRIFEPHLLAYGENYDNTQSCSAYFDSYLDALAQKLVEQREVRHATVVEVGCGKGHFLRKLVEYPGSGNRGIGFDPSYVGPDTDMDGRLLFRRSYYDDACADLPADVVVCRHVIEHVPDPPALLRSVRAALQGRCETRVFFETPSVEWILRRQVVWDFFYEHCSLFSPSSLTRTFELAGFQIEHIEEIFGGQYLWLEARPALADSVGTEISHDIVALAKAYGTREQVLQTEWPARLNALKQSGKTALWGAGAKGATFANLADPDCTLLDCVVDINPNKQGCYIPGSGHPIVAPEELPARGVHAAIMMNPNYHEENLRLLERAGITIELIDWSQ